MQDFQVALGTLKSRERALRLVARVAKDIDKLETVPSNDEIIALCSQHTTAKCNFER